MRAVAERDEQILRACAQRFIRFFPFRLSEEGLRSIYRTLLIAAREGRSPERDEERAAALIFKELGFFEPVAWLKPIPQPQRRSCVESKLFMALSLR